MDLRQDTKAITEVGESEFPSVVLAAEKPVLVGFLSSWSRPCQILEGVLAEVVVACEGKVRVVRVDADDHPDLSLTYDVQSVPTLLCFVAGVLRTRVVGTVTKEAILSRLQRILEEGDSFGRRTEEGASGWSESRR
jgi:thioredoxin 1